MKESLRNQKLLEIALADVAEMVNDKMLDTLADQEYRLCLLELGIN